MDGWLNLALALGVLAFRKKAAPAQGGTSTTDPATPSLSSAVVRVPMAAPTAAPVVTWVDDDDNDPTGNPPTLSSGPGQTMPPPAPPAVPRYEVADPPGQVCVWRIAPDGSLRRECYKILGTEP